MSDDEVIEQDEAAGMSGTKRITHASQSTEEKTGQIEMWSLLGDVAAKLAGDASRPDGQKEKLRRARAALDAAKLPAGRLAGWGSQARIRPAKHGNAFVVTRRRD
jgi:hypothetical protein